MIEIKKPDAALQKLLPPVSPRPDINYVPSQYALPFAHGGKWYVFHNLTKQCIEGVMPVSARAGEGWDELIAARFLVPEDKDECALYNQVSALLRALNRKKGLTGYTILPTLGCNARCVYCYEAGLEQVAMTPETVEQVIRFILDTCGEGPVKLKWFGGEPLLMVKAIDRVCEALREAGVEYKSSMISNGSLITPEIIEKMTRDWRFDYIQISMDGAEQDYNSRKRYYADHDYYHRVMESISALSAAGIRVSVRCNVDGKNWDGIPRYLKDMAEGVSDKTHVSIYFAPLFDVRAGADTVAMWRKVVDANPLIEAAGFHSTSNHGLYKRLRANHCMADSGRSAVILPDGRLNLCEHCPDEGYYGDIWRGVTDEAAMRTFSRTDVTPEKCRKCPYLPDCTSFHNCPNIQNHCREVRELLVRSELPVLLKQDESAPAEESDPNC